MKKYKMDKYLMKTIIRKELFTAIDLSEYENPRDIKKVDAQVVINKNTYSNKSILNIYSYNDYLYMKLDNKYKIKFNSLVDSLILNEIVNRQKSFFAEISVIDNSIYSIILTFPIKKTIEEDLREIKNLFSKINKINEINFDIYFLEFDLLATSLDQFQKNIKKYNDYLLKNKILPYSGLLVNDLEKNGRLNRFWETSYRSSNNDFSIVFNTKDNINLAYMKSDVFGRLGLVPLDYVNKLILFEKILVHYKIEATIQGGNYRILDNKADTCKTNIETHFIPYGMKIKIKI